jgi:hypothetical protein
MATTGATDDGEGFLHGLNIHSEEPEVKKKIGAVENSKFESDSGQSADLPWREDKL